MSNALGNQMSPGAFLMYRRPLVIHIFSVKTSRSIRTSYFSISVKWFDFSCQGNAQIHFHRTAGMVTRSVLPVSQVPARTILPQEGEIASKVFTIERGYFRAWFNGDEVTFQFFFEINKVSSIESSKRHFKSCELRLTK